MSSTLRFAIAAAGRTFARNGGSGRKIMITAINIAIIAAGLAAGSMFVASAGHASRAAPWCAVINLGMGDVYWDCQYRTIEECVPNVIAGNRGFCNLNPWGSGPGSAARTAVPHKRHSRHHVRRD